MNHARFRFYAELNDFLPENRKKREFTYDFKGNPSVKDAIQAVGVPHAEVDLILVNGVSVDFTCKLHDDDLVSVYPVFESLDIGPVTHLRKKPLRITKFIADVHLGKLAGYLRLLGFDTSFDNSLGDNEIIDMSLSERRIILTRDRGLLKNKKVTHGYWIRENVPGLQLKEVVDRFDLRNTVSPFTRCMHCNSLLEEAEKDEVYNDLLPKTRDFFDKFMKCSQCNRIYWEGSHYEKMKKLISEVTGNPELKPGIKSNH